MEHNSSTTVYHDKEEFEIKEGVWCGMLSSCFYITPVKIASADDHKIKESRSIRFYGDVMEYQNAAISIEEDYVYQFLFFFLDKWFNKELSHAYRVANGYDEEFLKEIYPEGEGFEWYLKYNVYTYEAIQDMLSEIKTKKTMLATDYFSHELDDLKKYFCYLSLCSEEKIKINPDEIPSTSWWYEEALKAEGRLVVDFYDRFIWYMERMMKLTPACSAIAFVGP